MQETQQRMFGPTDAFEDCVHGRDRGFRLGGITLPWPFPIAYGIRSSEATIFGRRVYGGGKRPVTRWLYRRIFEPLDVAWWEMKYRVVPSHRYHVVKTGLKPGCYDQDTRILHACMALLCEYVECMGGDEKLAEFTAELQEPGSEGHGPRESVDHQADRQSEALAIYRWWKFEKPADEARGHDLMMRLYGAGRSYTVPTDNPKLREIRFVPFEGDQIAQEAEYRRLERKISDDEQTMLMRLIAIRPSLWT